MCKGMDFLQFFFVAFVVKTERVIDNKLTPPHNNDIKVFPNELDNYFNSHIENMSKLFINISGSFTQCHLATN